MVAIINVHLAAFPPSSIVSQCMTAQNDTMWVESSIIIRLGKKKKKNTKTVVLPSTLCPPSLSPRLDFQCAGLESEMNHLFPAFSAEHAECSLQQDPLLFSCAGASIKYQRLCPCRDYRDGQVALCRDCLGPESPAPVRPGDPL